MELAYILIAAAIIILPFALTRLLSSGSKREGKMHGVKPSSQDTARAESEIMAAATAAKKGAERKAERRSKDGGTEVVAAEQADRTTVDAKAPVRDAGLVATIRHAQETTQEVQKLVAKGRKIEAIKILREKSGLGLKEAKDLVDRLG